ncbi:MAG: hypothetical protein IT353_02825 [Gemmatimonadaceae bacterium]|nr:hypothetical protein [Gemmatimonadaceae bacterium]
MATPLHSAPREPNLRLNGPTIPPPPRETPRETPSGIRRPESAVDPVVDMERLSELLRFPFGALRRHARLATLAFLGIFGTAIAAALFLPKTYRVESRILARRSMVLPALGNPRRTVPTESDAPARLAVQAVMSRESLIDIITATQLLDRIPDIVHPLTLVKEKARAMVMGPRSKKDDLDILVKMLEKRMLVLADDDKEGTVSISLRWRDQATALAIVQRAQQNFLDKRYDQEVSLVKESIGILERYVLSANTAIATSMAELRRLPGVRVNVSDPQRFAISAQTAARSRAVNAEMARAQAALTSVRNALGQQESAYMQRVSALQSRLTELESRFGPAHPEVAASRSALDAASPEPPALLALRREEQRLVSQLAQLGAAVPGSTDSGAELAMQRLNFERLLRERADSLEDPRVTYARSQLKIATTNYEDMLDRLEAARIELETARAAFKYRYTVISPPQFPKLPDAPNTLLLVVGGLFCAIFAAVFSATARDILNGRVVETWQVQRQLGLPLLGEIKRG